jgi:radical SAM superfamily enzyme YgiQ (UPF0313 family)
MNILLVYPKYPDTFWSFKHVLKFISKKASFPPLGLMTIAPMLPKDWQKKLVDVNISELKDEDILEADMVFISAMMVQKQNTDEIISRCKKFQKTIVAGGPLFSANPELYTTVDHLILNEAEITLPLFLKDLEQNKAQRVYTSDIKPNIAQTPIPDWSLIDMKNYVTMPVQYSRGCPFNCEFCDIIIMNGRIPRTKTTEQLIAEFDSLYKKGWRSSVFIVDDNFIGNKQNVKKMLPALIEWQKKHRYPFSLFTEASINLAEDDELMGLMSAANFSKVFLGIETTELKSLHECGKLQNTKTNLAEAVKKIQKHGMQVMAGFIVGFDSDSENVFETQIKFIQQVGVVTAMVGLLNAVPQTRLWNRLKSENRLLHNFSGENTDGFLNFIPKMGKEKLMAGYKKILSTIYSPKEYYRRIHTFIKNYKPTERKRLTFSDIKALLISHWRIGVISNSRFRYWWLLTKTFFTKIKALPVAVELAVIGLHFEKTAKKVVS